MLSREIQGLARVIGSGFSRSRPVNGPEVASAALDKVEPDCHNILIGLLHRFVKVAWNLLG